MQAKPPSTFRASLANNRAQAAAEAAYRQQILNAGHPLPAGVLNDMIRDPAAIRIISPEDMGSKSWARKHPVLTAVVVILALAAVGAAVYFGLAQTALPPCGNGEARIAGKCKACGGGVYCGNGVCEDQAKGGSCLACTLNADCGLGGLCVDAPGGAKQCTKGCATAADCDQFAATNGRVLCDTASGSTTYGTCVACTSGSQCKPQDGQPSPICSGGLCVYCGSQGMACDLGYNCVQDPKTGANRCSSSCTADSECGRGLLCVKTPGPDGDTSGTCQACDPGNAARTTCTVPTPFCSPTGTCVECTSSVGCLAPLTCDTASSTCSPPSMAGAKALSIYYAGTQTMWEGTALSLGVVTKTPPAVWASTYSPFSRMALSTPAFVNEPCSVEGISPGNCRTSSDSTEYMSQSFTKTFWIFPRSSASGNAFFGLAAHHDTGMYGLATCCTDPAGKAPTSVAAVLGSACPDGMQVCDDSTNPVNGGTASAEIENYYMINGFLVAPTSGTQDQPAQMGTNLLIFPHGTTTPVTGSPADMDLSGATHYAIGVATDNAVPSSITTATNTVVYLAMFTGQGLGYTTDYTKAAPWSFRPSVS